MSTKINLTSRGEPTQMPFLTLFDRKGGLGKFYDVFGDSYEAILQEMNMELVA